MRTQRLTRCLASVLAVSISPAGLAWAQDAPPSTVTREADAAVVVAEYAAFAHAIYAEAEASARALQSRIAEFLASPTAESLATAREAWIAGRRVYGQTEVLRFYNGPIDNPVDGVETYINAWPLDEAYIDAVAGDAGAGLIHDVDRFPNLNATLLTFANERGGEANVCLGWHAIEFMLWGQDLSEVGPGERAFTDFVEGEATGATRRRRYLQIVAELLVRHLAQVRTAWEPAADNYRARFVRDPSASVVHILTGMTVLSGFELAGERMAVAYETRDQEEEHSCFSDTTHIDYTANQRGVQAVWFGDGPGMTGVGLRALALRRDPELTRSLDAVMRTSARRLAAIPTPFDRAILGDDDAPGRRVVLAAITSLEEQAESLAALASVLGFEVPLRPGGR